MAASILGLGSTAGPASGGSSSAGPAPGVGATADAGSAEKLMNSVKVAVGSVTDTFTPAGFNKVGFMIDPDEAGIRPPAAKGALDKPAVSAWQQFVHNGAIAAVLVSNPSVAESIRDLPPNDYEKKCLCYLREMEVSRNPLPLTASQLYGLGIRPVTDGMRHPLPPPVLDPETARIAMFGGTWLFHTKAEKFTKEDSLNVMPWLRSTCFYNLSGTAVCGCGIRDIQKRMVEDLRQWNHADIEKESVRLESGVVKQWVSLGHGHPLRVEHNIERDYSTQEPQNSGIRLAYRYAKNRAPAERPQDIGKDLALVFLDLVDDLVDLRGDPVAHSRVCPRRSRRTSERWYPRDRNALTACL